MLDSTSIYLISYEIKPCKIKFLRINLESNLKRNDFVSIKSQSDKCGLLITNKHNLSKVFASITLCSTHQLNQCKNTEYTQVELKTNSTENLSISLTASLIEDFTMNIGEKRTNITIDEYSPVYWLLQFNDTNEDMEVKIFSEDDICMFAFVEKAECSVNMLNPRLESERVKTITRSGTILIKNLEKYINNSLFLVFRLNDTCVQSIKDSNKYRIKKFNIWFSNIDTNYFSHFYPFYVILVIFIAAGIVYVFFCTLLFHEELMEMCWKCSFCCKNSGTNNLEQVSEPVEEKVNEEAADVSVKERIEAVVDTEERIKPESAKVEVKKGEEALDSCKEKINKAKNVCGTCLRSCYFKCWSFEYFLPSKYILIISIFYILPTVQLLYYYTKVMDENGNFDLCFYNDLCSKPYKGLIAFNNIISNIGYMIMGLVFIIIVLIRHIVRKRQKKFFISPNYGIFYALGFSLIMEGIISGIYHICPHSNTIQFDLTFMYIIGFLIIFYYSVQLMMIFETFSKYIVIINLMDKIVTINSKENTLMINSEDNTITIGSNDDSRTTNSKNYTIYKSEVDTEPINSKYYKIIFNLKNNSLKINLENGPKEIDLKNNTITINLKENTITIYSKDNNVEDLSKTDRITIISDEYTGKINSNNITIIINSTDYSGQSNSKSETEENNPQVDTEGNNLELSTIKNNQINYTVNINYDDNTGQNNPINYTINIKSDDKTGQNNPINYTITNYKNNTKKINSNNHSILFGTVTTNSQYQTIRKDNNIKIKEMFFFVSIVMLAIILILIFEEKSSIIYLICISSIHVIVVAFYCGRVFIFNKRNIVYPLIHRIICIIAIVIVNAITIILLFVVSIYFPAYLSIYFYFLVIIFANGLILLIEYYSIYFNLPKQLNCCPSKTGSNICKIVFIIINILAAFALTVSAGYYYSEAPTDWNKSPSQSRERNQECIWLNFYDIHDIWHMLSSGAAFLVFMLIFLIDGFIYEKLVQNCSVYICHSCDWLEYLRKFSRTNSS